MMPSSNGSSNLRRTWQTNAVERSNYGQHTRKRVTLHLPNYTPRYAPRYVIPLPAHPPQEEPRSIYHSTESCLSMNNGRKMQSNNTKISPQPEHSPHRSKLTYKPCTDSSRRQEWQLSVQQLEHPTAPWPCNEQQPQSDHHTRTQPANQSWVTASALDPPCNLICCLHHQGENSPAPPTLSGTLHLEHQVSLDHWDQTCSIWSCPLRRRRQQQ
jgi:hypothetical protein